MSMQATMAAFVVALLLVAAALVGIFFKRRATCDTIERVDGSGLSKAEFSRRYRPNGIFDVGCPVILTNLTDSWPLRQTVWTSEGFAEKFGHLEVDQDDANPAVAGGEELPRTTLGESLLAPQKNRTAVWFLRAQNDISQQIEQLMSVPEPLIDVQMVGPQVSIGLEGHGGWFNIHLENWLAQVSGRKRWMLVQKGSERPAYAESLHPCKYSEAQAQLQLSKKTVQECEVAPGEILYVPSHWDHATCNLDSGFNLALGFIAAVDHLTGPHRAAATGDFEAISRLTESQINGADKNGHTVLHAAVGGGRVSIVQALLSMRAAVDCKERENGMTPLHTACSYGHAAIASVLIESRASIHAEDGSGRTASFSAAYEGAAKVLKVLLEAGAPVEGTNGNRLIDAAMTYGHKPVAQLLIERNASVAPPVLHNAAYQGHGEVVEMLIAARADTHATVAATNYGPRGSQPLHMAAVSSYPEAAHVVTLLLGARADFAAKTETGETAWKLARQNSQDNPDVGRQILNSLKKYKASKDRRAHQDEF